VIAAHTIQSLRQASVPALVADYMDLRKSGPRWTAPCPFHNEKTPSFMVYDDHFHCFGCGASGSAIDFLMRIEGIRFPEAARMLAERTGVTIDARPLSAEQARQAAEDAEFCRWWWRERFTAMESAVHEAVAEEDWDFAEVAGGVLVRMREMGYGERFTVFKRDATARDRAEWRDAVAREADFRRAWLGLAELEWAGDGRMAA
jgi:hypothetical protein